MRKEDKIKLESLTGLMSNLEQQWKEVDREQSAKDTERYRVWEDMMRPFHSKKQELVDKMKSLETERERLEHIKNHEHDWYFLEKWRQPTLPLTYKCRICGKTKTKKNKKKI
jgi:endogenous inhibitor of DNA gyrase (YacG/DUF329 family)